MPAVLVWIAGLFVKLLLLRFVLKLVFMTTVGLLSASFLTEITGLLDSISLPVLHPYLQKGLQVFPPNTATYITICISALTARWVFVSQVKAGRILLE